MTYGNETKSIVKFAIPLALGNVFQQVYNLCDTLIVGRFVGKNALAAVGSTYTLMIFITSIIIGLCIGSSVVFSRFYGAKDYNNLQRSFFISFIIIAILSIILNSISLIFVEPILRLIQIPNEIMNLSLSYTFTVFFGIFFIFLYNYYSAVFRSMGNSTTPLIFLAISTIINIILDLVFIINFKMGVFGAALATVIAQVFSGVGLAISCHKSLKETKIKKENMVFDRKIRKLILNFSLLSSIQQSVMNLGILMIQGLVNSFGVTIMAGFACAVKIDTIAYVPVQDFGNAFSTFIAQNLGARKFDRISKGSKSSFKIVSLVCIPISILVYIFAPELMQLFLSENSREVINVGVQYLRIEGTFYVLIGYLFLFYGMFRGWGKPFMSIVLTIASLGTRVALSYILAPNPSFGVVAIWWSIPIGWLLADIIGFIKMKKEKIILEL
ncbi:MAG: MATE family efflux transporter [Tissierellia bacterium]|nr:MATE family efflux transporter [Tissierellia bacterium]